MSTRMASLRPVSVSRPAWQRSLAALAAVSVLAGCASTATPTPAVQVPTQWQHARSTTPGQMLPDRWWQAFGDARLNQLVELALQRNTNLAQAAYKVRNAQLQAGNAAGNRLPTPSASVNTSGSRPLDGDGGTNRNYSVSLGVSWEADLWGKLATQQRMADWEAVATEQDRQAAAHALVATVAKTWWQLAVAENKLASQRQSLARANKTLQLAEVQYRAGAISGLDLAQARQSQASQQAAIHQLEQQGTELRNALAILFDAPPGQLPPGAEPPRLPNLARLPAVPAGVPAELLGRRPDLQAAELRLRSSLANVDAVRTSYYPTLSLTGSLGGSSNALSQLLSNPVGTLGAGLILPFLKAGEMQRNTAIAQNSYEQAVLGFRQTLYQAFADVENALSGRTNLQQQVVQLQQALAQAERAEQLMEVRYRAGAVPLKFWLDAQETRRNAALALQDVQLARLVNLVTLYQALGGSLLLAPVPVEQAPLRTQQVEAAIGA